MVWARILAYITGTVDQELLLRNEYLAAENRTLEVILGNCLAHGRRRFVKVAQNFPEECRFVLETLAEIYHNDELTGEQGMSPEQRLGFHQARSGPVMAELHAWLTAQLQERKRWNPTRAWARRSHIY